ncbi:MAG TPA: cupin domain-containing protein [Armatimonadetes bacterium]|nr:cupin domain-containing protein [Armatimonadota bacterium]
MEVISRDECEPFTTLDGSTIREIASPRNSSLKNTSLAEATVPPGMRTKRHYHKASEEVYYILEGRGVMWLEGEEREVGPGDAVVIPPGRSHQIFNPGPGDLVFLCICSPPYEHEDTVLIERAG